MLSNTSYVEEGYTKRDLALGCLVTFHDFNIEKALSNQLLQKRKVVFTDAKNEKKEVVLIAGLYDHHFKSIIHYAFSEKWPLTSQGLFCLLKKWQKPRDVTLEKAFFITEEFYIISNLFTQPDISIRDQEILDLICECSWNFIENFTNKQKVSMDNSREQRLQFLLYCLKEGSSQASTLLIKTDFIYVVKRLPDDQILKLLSLLKEPTKELEQFCVELLKSSRSDQVWKMAATKLYEISNESVPINLIQKEVISKFVFSDNLKNKWQNDERRPSSLSSIIWSKKKLRDNIHIVRDGDNLWKIARIYKVDIDELIRVNNLTTHTMIYPGLELVIPKER